MPFRLDQPDSSFYDLLNQEWSNLRRPSWGKTIDTVIEGKGKAMGLLPHGTTVLAIKYRDGIVMAGDRMATEGLQVSARKIEKVYRADEYSAIAISGAAGPSIEMARLFQVELEHYEKLEGFPLSTEGKANKLSQMIRGNLPMALQGLVVIPIFAGYDLKKKEGRIYKYDVTGGRYEETDYYATGSGGKDARNTMKKYYKKDIGEDETLRIALEALYDASDEDIGTGGPDMIREIYPTVKFITGKGTIDVDDIRIKEVYSMLLGSRKEKTGL